MLEPAAPPAAPAPAPAAPPAGSPRAVPTFGAFRAQVTTGSILALTFRVWLRSLFRFTAMGLAVMVPAMLGGIGLAIALGRGGRAGTTLATATLVLFALLLLYGTAVSMGGVTHGAVQQLAGRPVRVGAMLGTGLRRGLPVLAALLLALLATGAGLLLLVVPGLVVATGLTVSIPALVGERLGPLGALRRSWELTRDHRLSLFLAALVIGLLQLGVNAFTEQLLPVLMGPGAAAIGVSFAVSVLFLPVPSLFPAVAWHELRVAKEGAATSDILAVFE